MKVYRIQDREGRGPFRPGFSKSWLIDRPDLDNLPPYFEAFDMREIIRKGELGDWMGCGCLSPTQLRRWFIADEYSRLMSYGYRAVCLSGCRILAKNNTQVVFARKMPHSEGATIFKLYKGGRL